MIVTGSASILSRIIDMGFDGALLDRVDAYGDWERQRSSARREMVALVEKVADVARRAIQASCSFRKMQSTSSRTSAI